MIDVPVSIFLCVLSNDLEDSSLPPPLTSSDDRQQSGIAISDSESLNLSRGFRFAGEPSIRGVTMERTTSCGLLSGPRRKGSQKDLRQLEKRQLRSESS